MGQQRLSSLANLQIEKNYCIDFDQVFDEFDATCLERGRRLSLK